MINEKKIIKKSLNKDIIVNYTCFCKKYFYNNQKLIYLLPCCHIIHETCFHNFIIKNNYMSINNNQDIKIICPFCNMSIFKVLTENKIKFKKKYHQFKIDMQSIKIDTSVHVNYINLPSGIFTLNTIINKLLLSTNMNDIINCIEILFKTLNIKLNIIDNTIKNNFKIIKKQIVWNKNNDQKLVIISNHSFYLDMVIIIYLFRCGFISNDFIKTIDFGIILCQILNLLIFKRGVDTNMVEKIKEYLNTVNNRIAIFPEGAFFNNNTLGRFRTGAFYTEVPVCPIIIKYNKIPYSDSFNDFLLKFVSIRNINIDVYINDFFYPPFNDQKIEYVRNYMAKTGNLNISRVSNKSIKN